MKKTTGETVRDSLSFIEKLTGKEIVELENAIDEALTQHHQDELREVVNEAIRLSDEAERGHETEFNEWRAFKGFRNGLRDYAKTQGINL